MSITELTTREIRQALFQVADQDMTVQTLRQQLFHSETDGGALRRSLFGVADQQQTVGALRQRLFQVVDQDVALNIAAL
jgi:F0F1-type ATP synthase delta subunit